MDINYPYFNKVFLVVQELPVFYRERFLVDHIKVISPYLNLVGKEMVKVLDYRNI